jgi:hypothetical protein
VDPADPNHVFVGLEEVYETEDGGSHWTTIGPYWNFGFKCWNVGPSRNTCPLSTHPDQHSIVIDGNRVYVGNDGGIFRRPLRGHVNANGNATDWENLNATSGRCSTTPWRLAECRAVWPSPVACRTTADRCCCPKT